MSDNFISSIEAQGALMRGVDKVADAVKGTLGAAGYNFMSEAVEYPYHIISNDGISLARAIVLEDPYERMGANLIKEIGSRADKNGGDGTTTATVLAQAILREGKKWTANAIDKMRSLEECWPIIEAAIKDQTKEITVDEVGQVATISAEDPKLGALIQEIYQKIGKDGILYPDISKTTEDYYTLGTGVKIEGAGLVSQYMADADEKGNFQPSATLKNVKVMLCKQKITSAAELQDVAKALYDDNYRDLLIFCNDFEAPVPTDLVMTRARRGFRVVLVKLPTLWKDQWFEDLAKMTGASIVDAAGGLSFKTLKMSDLGTLGSAVIDKSDTFLDGIEDISEYLKGLQAGDDDDKIRAARLNTKTARLYVGAASDSALSYKRLKLEDARNAAWQALQGGVVPGGGVSLRNCADKMPDTLGGNILRVALLSPAKQIAINAGQTEMKVDGADYGGTRGFDAKTNQFVDMFEAGIIDPANVTLSSIRNALSVAAKVLSVGVMVRLPEQGNLHNPTGMAVL